MKVQAPNCKQGTKKVTTCFQVFFLTAYKLQTEGDNGKLSYQ